MYLPPGDYTSGTLLLRSHVNIYIEAGATLFASEDPAAFDLQKVKSKDALFFGEDLEDICDWRPRHGGRPSQIFLGAGYD